MRTMRALATILFVVASLFSALAQETPVSPDTAAASGGRENPFDVHGFLLGAGSLRTTGVQPRGGDSDFVLGEARLRLDVSTTSQRKAGDLMLQVKGDICYDVITSEVDLDLREAYAGYTRGPLDLRLGRQIVTWGVGDLVFINDVFPKDWESFFSGRPAEYLKLGADGFRVRYSSDALNVEFLTIPFFTEDNLPSPERFFLFDPASGVPRQGKVEPAAKLSNTELALRVYRQVAGFDLSLYAYRGFGHTPSVQLDNPVFPITATRFFPELSVYGASAQRSLWEGVLSLEVGCYDSREDRSGTDPARPNSQWRFLVGYQREPWSDFTIGLQFYGELMDSYEAYRDSLPHGSASQDEFHGVVSARLTQLLDYQAWKLSLFAAWSPTDEDYFLQPIVAYKATDNLTMSIGANLFGGQSITTSFGQFDKGDNIFANLRFDF